MLSCVIVLGLLLGGICGCGLGLGLLLRWLVPAIDRGMATLCGLVATGVALLACEQLLTLAQPSAAEGGAVDIGRLPALSGALCALADHLPYLHDSRPGRLPPVAIRPGHRPLGFLRCPGAGRQGRSL